MSESTQAKNQQRYEISDFFSDMGGETNMIYKIIGVIIVLLLLGLAFCFPVLVSGDAGGNPPANHDAPASSEPPGSHDEH